MIHNSISTRRQFHSRLLLVSLSLCLLPPAADTAFAARTLIKNICRVKGQEENTLRGLGLVVGLKGTGDSDKSLPTMRALARAMELLRHPVAGPELDSRQVLESLKGTRNVALVWVSTTVPASGGRSGDKLDCSVSAISAKSLEGGRLAFAALHGPNVNDPTIYGLAQGRIQLDNFDYPVEGKIAGGCQLQQDIFNDFVKDGKITLVLDENHADFQIAQGVAEAINQQLGYRGDSGVALYRNEIAKPLDAVNIEVHIPEQYADYPVAFVAEIRDLPVFEVQTEARVVINERAESIVISGEAKIGPVVVTHKNITVEADAEQRAAASRFVPIDPDGDSPDLKSLIETLNAIQVPTRDIIEIIKGIDRNGRLHAHLIIE